MLVMMKMDDDRLTENTLCSDTNRSVRSDLNHLLQFKKKCKLPFRVHSPLDQTKSTHVIHSIDNTCNRFATQQCLLGDEHSLRSIVNATAATCCTTGRRLHIHTSMARAILPIFSWKQLLLLRESIYHMTVCSADFMYVTNDINTISMTDDYWRH